jgi:HPt (histidine-containing phosphotransfer) domain-containing protein
MNSTDGTPLSCIARATFDGLRGIVGDDGLAALIAMYQEESDRMLADIETAAADDLEALERHLHLLKGVSSNFGLDQVVSAASAAMAACREGRGADARAITAKLPSLTRQAQSALKAIAATLS